MRLSTKGRYAVMAMADLARNSSTAGGERAVSLAEIATRQEISLSYLEQLFARLRRSGLVKSVRGPGGGYRLAHSAADTWVADIVLAVDEPAAIGRRFEQPLFAVRGPGRSRLLQTLRTFAHAASSA